MEVSSDGVLFSGLAIAEEALDTHPLLSSVGDQFVLVSVGQIRALVTQAIITGQLGGDADFADSLATALSLLAPLESPALEGTPTAPTQAAGNRSTRLASTAFVGGEIDAIGVGQCRLTLSGGNLLLSRCAGRWVTINGKREEIPSAGVSLGPSGFTAGQNYLIAAYMNSSVMTLERLDMATYFYAMDPTTGMPVKKTISGGALDSTRTIVGMVGAVAGPAFADTAAQRLVLSYFNRRTIGAQKSFSTDRTTGSTSYVEIDSEIRAEFLTWDDEAILSSLSATVNNGTGGRGTITSIAFDGTTADAAEGYFVSGSASYDGVIGLTLIKSGLSAGRHYATVLGKTDGSGTSKWRGVSAAFGRTVLSVTTRG